VVRIDPTDSIPTEPELEIGEPDREKRVRHRLSVGMTAKNGQAIAGTSINLSEHGLTMHATRLFPPGTELKVVIQLPDSERATVTGTVAWARKGAEALESRMGIKFASESPSWTAFLKRFHPETFRKG
jgi:hypothetical protein